MPVEPSYLTVTLLDRDSGAGALQGGLGLLCGLLVDPLEESLGGTVDKVLGLLEAQAGQGPDLLDDLNLLLARSLEDDIELVLLLDLFGRRAAASGRRASHGDRCRGLDIEGLLELLHEIRQLDQRHLLERVE